MLPTITCRPFVHRPRVSGDSGIYTYCQASVGNPGRRRLDLAPRRRLRRRSHPLCPTTWKIQSPPSLPLDCHSAQPGGRGTGASRPRISPLSPELRLPRRHPRATIFLDSQAYRELASCNDGCRFRPFRLADWDLGAIDIFALGCIVPTLWSNQICGRSRRLDNILRVHTLVRHGSHFRLNAVSQPTQCSFAPAQYGSRLGT